jgi:hypothetical protein
MPPLLTDPNTLQCPEYKLDSSFSLQQRLISDNTTHKQAVVLLHTIWIANNKTDKVLWQEQLQADAHEANEACHIHMEEEAEHEAEKQKEKEELRQEDMKKNKTKYTPIPARGIPDLPPVVPIQCAVMRLKKGKYVPLWYFTNAGLESALKNFSTTNNKALSMIRAPDSSTSWISAPSSLKAKGLVEDRDLIWEDFCIVVSRIVPTMRAADWDPNRVNMLVAFLTGIQTHSF